MPALRPLHWELVEKILLRLSFRLHRTKGSHKIYAKSGHLMHVTVPANRNIPVGTLTSIIRQMGITREEFLTHLENIRH